MDSTAIQARSSKKVKAPVKSRKSARRETCSAPLRPLLRRRRRRKKMTRPRAALVGGRQRRVYDFPRLFKGKNIFPRHGWALALSTRRAGGRRLSLSEKLAILSSFAPFYNPCKTWPFFTKAWDLLRPYLAALPSPCCTERDEGWSGLGPIKNIALNKNLRFFGPSLLHKPGKFFRNERGELLPTRTSQSSGFYGPPR